MANIFQTPTLLLIAALAALIVVTIFRRYHPQKRKWWQLVLPLAIALSAFGTDFLLQTDYEKIDQMIKTGKEAVIAASPEQINAIISPDYRDSFHNSKAEIMNYCRALLAGLMAEKIKTRYVTTEISAPRATSEMELAVHLRQESVYAIAGRIVFIKLKLYLSNTADKRWFIDSSEIITVNNQPAGWKKVRAKL